MNKKALAGVCWWPHSGGRWLCRSLLKRNTKVIETAMVHPWLFNSTDDVMNLDITAQVHKARSLVELKPHLEALKKSTDVGRRTGLTTYFNEISDNYKAYNQTHIIGEMCMGSPIPKYMDVETLYEAVPDFKLIHLVRNPVSSFNSFAKRYELDSDPIKVAGSWLALNSKIRTFFDQNPDKKKYYLLVRYEDLIANTTSELERICEFLGLPFESSMIEDTDEIWGRGTKDDILPIVKKRIEEIAYSELKEYNYELKSIE